jgi:dynein heavy chain, axonemal
LIKNECDEALSKVIPIYEKAMKAVKALKASDVTEMKGTKVPSQGLRTVAQVLCMYFDVKPKIIRGQTAAEGNKEDYWEPCLKQLLNPKLLSRLQEYDKDDVKPELVEKLVPILESADYTEAKMKTVSAAALGISNWTKAIVQYDSAMKIVKPKQKELAEASEASKKAQEALQTAQANLKKVQDEFQALVEKLDETQRQEKALRDKKDNCEKKVELANKLITSLGGERENWIKLLEKRRGEKENIVGDTVVCSGYLAYLGVFIS